jgi:hypothetical protein
MARLTMDTTVLDRREDLEWLRDVHGVDIFTEKGKRAVCAIIHGNEDCPERVELFDRNHYKAKPFRVYVQNEETRVLEIEGAGESTTQ